MALPPTGFSVIVDEASDPEDLYARLREADCLSEAARADPNAAIGFIRRRWTWERIKLEMKPPGWTGPNLTDRLASALLDSPHVNERARELAGRQAGGGH